LKWIGGDYLIVVIVMIDDQIMIIMNIN